VVDAADQLPRLAAGYRGIRRMPRARDKQRTGGLVDTLVGCRCQPRFASLDHQHPARSAAANDGFAPSINCRFSDVHRGHFRFTPFHPEFPVLSTP